MSAEASRVSVADDVAEESESPAVQQTPGFLSSLVAVASKDLRLLVRDRGALFWACVFPLCFALLFGAIMPGERSDRRIPVVVAGGGDAATAALVRGLSQSGAMGVTELPEAEARARVQRGEAVAMVQAGAPVRLLVDPTHPAEGAIVESNLARALSTCAAPPVERSVASVSPPKSGFEVAFPAAVLWGLIGCAGAFAAASVAERRSGTHLRLRASPLPFGALLGGKLLACLVACVVDATLLLLIARFAFGVRVERFVALPLAIGACAICFAGITVLLGAFGKSEQGVGGAGWATLLLFAMLGGAMVPLSVMPEWLRRIAVVSPVKWGIGALEGATFRGLSMQEILPSCAVLVCIGVASVAFGALLSRRTT